MGSDRVGKAVTTGHYTAQDRVSETPGTWGCRTAERRVTDPEVDTMADPQDGFTKAILSIVGGLVCALFAGIVGYVIAGGAGAGIGALVGFVAGMYIGPYFGGKPGPDS